MGKFTVLENLNYEGTDDTFGRATGNTTQSSDIGLRQARYTTGGTQEAR